MDLNIDVMRTSRCLLAMLCAAAAAVVLPANSFGAERQSRRGTITYSPPESEQKVPETFRLAAHEFTFVEQPRKDVMKSIRSTRVTFPSPVTTEHPNNNTVHCEYFLSTGEGPAITAGSDPDASSDSAAGFQSNRGKRPGVIVLHILGGNFQLSRLVCRALALRGAGALFVKMPYYGPRRQEGDATRMISDDPQQTVRGMTQAVLDIRRATAWLAAQEEIDPQKLGITGISLGGIVAALATTAEPRFQRACLVLAGGDVAQVTWNLSAMSNVRKTWTSAGGTKHSWFELLESVDPVTYAENVRGRKILMLNAVNDEIIPRSCTESLWRAFGQPEIVWWNAGHYSAVRYLPDALIRMTDFFQPDSDWPEEDPSETTTTKGG